MSWSTVIGGIITALPAGLLGDLSLVEVVENIDARFLNFSLHLLRLLKMIIAMNTFIVQSGN